MFSFNAVRIPNTIDGGAVIFKDKALYKKSLGIRDCGIDRSIYRDLLGEINLNCGISEIGYSATMSNVNGYIGSKQMEVIQKHLSLQRRNADAWQMCIGQTVGVKAIITKDALANYWVYGILSNNKDTSLQLFVTLDFTRRVCIVVIALTVSLEVRSVICLAWQSLKRNISLCCAVGGLGSNK